MSEHVVTPHWSLSRILRIDGPKLTFGVDVTNRFGIDECRRERKRLAGTDVLHPEVLDLEFKGMFVGSIGIDDKRRGLGVKPVDRDADFLYVGGQCAVLFALAFRGYVQLQSFYKNRTDVHGRSEKVGNAGTESKLVD